MVSSPPRDTRAPFINSTPHPENSALLEIEPHELAAESSRVRIIDVRGEAEYEGELGHISGSTLMPLPSISARIGELSKNETIVFVCRSGGRSANAAIFAIEAGISSVYNMKGGMLRWNELGLPVER